MAAPAAPTASAGPAAAARPGRVVAAPATAFIRAAAVLDALAVRQLVAQAALQPAAHARELGRIEAELLLLGHLDRDGLEGLQPGRAAERAPTGSIAAEHPRLVADANLAHLDTC